MAKSSTESELIKLLEFELIVYGFNLVRRTQGTCGDSFRGAKILP